MNTELIQVYAYSNLHKALLVNFYADIIAHDKKPIDAFHAFRNDVLSDLKTTVFPDGDPNAEHIRRCAIDAIPRFFRDVEDKLIIRGVLKKGDVQSNIF
jgi:hypothetical protein